MSGLLNGDFETWSSGPSFNPVTDGQQLADNWYWNNGDGTGNPISTRRSSIPDPNTGTYYLTFQLGTGSDPNTTTYIYQDLANYAGYKNATLTFTCYLGPANGRTVKLFIDDGVTRTYSTGVVGGPSPSWTQDTVTKVISGSATQVRIGIINPTYSTGSHLVDTGVLTSALIMTLPETISVTETLAKKYFRLLTDIVTLSDSYLNKFNFFIRLALSDAISQEETMIPPTGPVQTGKRVTDSIRIFEWLHKRKRKLKQGIWGN